MTDKNTIREVLLRDGTTQPEPLVMTTYVALLKLMDSPMRFLDVAEAAREESPLHPNSVPSAAALALVDENGDMHSSVRSVIRSCIEGEGLEMRLVSPFAEREA